MKNIFYLFIYLFICSCSENYTSYKCNDIYLGGSNVLFVHIENKIEIKNYSGNFRDLQLLTKGKVFMPKVEEKLFFVTFDVPGIYNLKLIDKKEVHVLEERKFIVKPAPLPVPSIDNVMLFESKVFKQQLLKSKGIYAELNNWAINLRYRIVSFSIVAIESGTMIKIKNKGSDFNNNQMDWIKSLTSGEYLFITDILIEMPDKKIRKISPLIYEIQ